MQSLHEYFIYSQIPQIYINIVLSGVKSLVLKAWILKKNTTFAVYKNSGERVICALGIP
jgi:hypothetical protein